MPDPAFPPGTPDPFQEEPVHALPEAAVKRQKTCNRKWGESSSWPNAPAEDSAELPGEEVE